MASKYVSSVKIRFISIENFVKLTNSLRSGAVISTFSKSRASSI